MVNKDFFRSYVGHFESFFIILLKLQEDSILNEITDICFERNLARQPY